MTDDEAFEEPLEQARCPACLAAVDGDQQYCLQCGERLAPAGPPASSPLGGRTRPPAAAIVAGGALLLLVGGFGIAYGFTRDDTTKASGTTTVRTGSSTGVAVPSTQTIDTGGTSVPTFTGTTASTFPTVPTGTDTTPTFPTTGTTSRPDTTDPPPQTDTTQETSDWPSGRDAFTVILASDDTERYTFQSITAKKQTALDNGFANAGVLNSDDYFRLNPGYWVLFLGPYSSKSAAQAAQATARAKGYPDAYVRRVAE